MTKIILNQSDFFFIAKIILHQSGISNLYLAAFRIFQLWWSFCQDNNWRIFSLHAVQYAGTAVFFLQYIICCWHETTDSTSLTTNSSSCQCYQSVWITNDTTTPPSQQREHIMRVGLYQYYQCLILIVTTKIK